MLILSTYNAYNGSFYLKKGRKDTEEIYKKIFQEALRFARLIERKGAEILKKIVPYDLRTGKIKGKYIFDKVLSLREKIIVYFGVDLLNQSHPPGA